MYKERSLSKLSSKSLSKIQTKIQLAFAKKSINENKEKSQQNILPSRSKSMKSLAKSKCESVQTTIPFAIALKGGLIQTDKKEIGCRTPSKLVKAKLQSYDRKKQINQSYSMLKNSEKLANQRIFLVPQLIKGAFLRMQKQRWQNLEAKNNKNSRKVIAALQEDYIYVGSKQYMLVKSNKSGLIDKEESHKASIKDCDFLFVINEFLINNCNLSRLITDIYGLIQDGVDNLDAIVKIVGRKLTESQASSDKNRAKDMFILIILIENNIDFYHIKERKQAICKKQNDR